LSRGKLSKQIMHVACAGEACAERARVCACVCVQLLELAGNQSTMFSGSEVAQSNFFEAATLGIGCKSAGSVAW